MYVLRCVRHTYMCRTHTQPHTHASILRHTRAQTTKLRHTQQMGHAHRKAAALTAHVAGVRHCAAADSQPCRCTVLYCRRAPIDLSMLTRRPKPTAKTRPTNNAPQQHTPTAYIRFAPVWWRTPQHQSLPHIRSLQRCITHAVTAQIHTAAWTAASQ